MRGRRWPAASAAEAESRLTALVGYGVAALGDGVLTPYGSMSLAQSARIYQVGTRLELGSAVQVSLAGEQRVTAGAATDHGVTLSGRLTL